MNLLLSAAAAEPDPAGLAAGRYPVPAFVIWIVGGVVLALAVLVLVIRARRARASNERRS